MKTIQELVTLLSLEQTAQNTFKGENYQAPWKRVFGGQVLAQSLFAAYQTVPNDRVLHSMHGYFILTGDISMPIYYEVDRIRDGGSFTTRRVNAIQNGKVIFSLGCSFQISQEGFEHQITMPNVPPPEALLSDLALLEAIKDKAPDFYKNFSHPRPLEFRPVERINPLKPQKQQPFRHVWIKANGDLPQNLWLHQIILAYASDYNLLGTATFPHLDSVSLNDLFMASLDHAMWFHQDFRIDQWLLYAIDSPSAFNSRGFTRGNFFTEDGRLVASVVQEGLIRVKK